MKTLLSRFGEFLKTRKGRLTTLWVATALLLIIALFNGFGQPVFSYIFYGKTDEIAKPKYNQGVYEQWYQGEKNIAKIEGREWQDPRKTEQASLIGTWKWWISFGILFLVAISYSSVIIIGKTGHLAKDGSIYTGGKIKDFWLYGEQKIKEIWRAINEERHKSRVLKILEKDVVASSGSGNSTVVVRHPFWKTICTSVLGGLILLGLLKLYTIMHRTYKRRWAK